MEDTVRCVAVRVCVASKGSVNKRTWLPAHITDKRFSRLAVYDSEFARQWFQIVLGTTKSHSMWFHGSIFFRQKFESIFHVTLPPALVDFKFRLSTSFSS
jgi:hypothetical protein